jgi:conjugal transfer pilus assembly protein TraV
MGASGFGKVFAIGVLCVMAAACAGVGEKQFSCPGRPPGVHCMTATEVYAATETSDVVEPTASHAMGDDPKRAHDKHQHGRKTDSSQGGSDRGANPQRAPGRSDAQTPASAGGLTPTVSIRGGSQALIPIRTPAQVMRAWIAPWQDVHGVLHGDSDHFIEIESRRWSLGEPDSSTEPVRFFAIQKVDPTEAVGKDPSASATRAGVSERSKQPTSSTLPKSGASPWSNSNRGAQPP